MKDTLIEIKNYLQGNDSRMDKVKNQINDVEHKEPKNNQSEQHEEKRIQKHEDSVSILWDNFKSSNICIILPEGEEKEQEIGTLFEKIMKENFLKLMKEIDLQVQEAQRISNKMDAKSPTPGHIIVKMPKVKDKERILKTARKKQIVIYKGVLIRLSADFSKETLQAKRDWHGIFKLVKSKDLQTR